MNYVFIVSDTAIFLNNIAGLSNFILVLLALFPFFLNLRYYIKTKIKDYLYLSIFFFHWSFIASTFFWYWPFNIFNTIIWEGAPSTVPNWLGWIIYNIFLLLWNSLDAIFLVIVALRAKYGETIRKYPQKILALISIMIIFVLIALFDQERTETTIGVPTTNLTYWAVWLSRLVFHGIIVFTFLTSEFSKTKRAVRSRNLWISSSILWVIAMIGFIIGGLIGYPQDGSILFLDLVTTSSFTFAALLMLINHIAHPESVLITYEQIHTALRLYEKIDLQGNIITDFGIARIKSYLDQVSGIVKDELRRNQFSEITS